MSKDGTSLREMAAQWLRENHYDGLCNPDGECGCGLDDLMPCQCPNERDCVCAYEIPAEDSGYDRMFSTSNSEQNAPSDNVERVARDLFNAIAPMHEHCNEDTCCNLADDGWKMDCCLHDFRRRFEALGVAL